MDYVWMWLLRFHFLQVMLPPEAVGEIVVSVSAGELLRGSFTAMVTAGAIGVAASAGLLLLSNHRR